MAESFFDEGFGRKVAGLIGGWKEGNPVEIQKRSENPRYGKEYPSSQFTYEKVPYPGAVVAGKGALGGDYGRLFDESDMPVSERKSFPYETQFMRGGFNYIPASQIPEDYMFGNEAGVHGAHRPSQLRAAYRRMSDAELQKDLFGREMPNRYGGTSVADMRSAQDGRRMLDPAWSIGYQDYLNRTASERPQVLASRGPLPEDDGIVSLDALTRARQ